MSKPFFVTLPNRGLLRIEGEDRFTFLQGLISNDMRLLETQKVIYACLLTPQGKFLHDFFVVNAGDYLLIECEGGERAQDLARRLNLYRLRAKVQITAEDCDKIYAVIGTGFEDYLGDGGYEDPRHAVLGGRSVLKPDSLEERDFSAWDQLRISHIIPDGSRDMELEKSTLLECGIDRLNGVSFQKGCFIGQELTARMHHRGLAKKHLYALRGAMPEYGADITADGKLIGEMRSSCGDSGLALLRDDMVGQIAAAGLSVIEA